MIYQSLYMGCQSSINYEIIKPATLPLGEFKWAIKYCINKRNFYKLFEYLDYLKEKNVSIDSIYHSVLHYDLICYLHNKKKRDKELLCQVLEKLLRDYDLDVNKAENKCGNIIHELLYCEMYDVKVYEILVRYGANINYVFNNQTPLDIIEFYTEKDAEKQKKIKVFLMRNRAMFYEQYKVNRCVACGRMYDNEK